MGVFFSDMTLVSTIVVGLQLQIGNDRVSNPQQPPSSLILLELIKEIPMITQWARKIKKVLGKKKLVK